MIQGCGVCNENASKYKCPECYLPFCSVGCCQTHKGSPDCKPTQVENTASNVDGDSQFLTENSVPPETLAKLDNNEKLKQLLKSRHLRDTLKAIDSSRNPEKVLEDAMRDPQFEEFVQVCLQDVEIPEKVNSDR